MSALRILAVVPDAFGDLGETPRSGDFQIAEPSRMPNGAAVRKPPRPKQSGDMDVAAPWAMTFAEVSLGAEIAATAKVQSGSVSGIK
jgi:hypothetical protein